MIVGREPRKVQNIFRGFILLLSSYLIVLGVAFAFVPAFVFPVISFLAFVSPSFPAFPSLIRAAGIFAFMVEGIVALHVCIAAVIVAVGVSVCLVGP